MDVIISDLSTCEAEVADLQVAVLIKQQVGWLEIAVENACAVNVFESS